MASAWDTYKGIETGPFSMLDSFLHPERGYQRAQDELNRGQERAEGYQLPFQEAGRGAIPGLQQAGNELLDPEALEAKWVSGYEESPYTKQLKQEAMNSGMEGASQMGLMGSSAALSNVQQGASKIGNQARSQYLDDLMRKYQAGIGVNQNLFGTGAAAGANLGQGALQTGQNLGMAAFGEQNSPGDLFNNMMKMGVQAYTAGG